MRPQLFIFILFLVPLTSCHTASYRSTLSSTTYGVDYRKGKWLLNTIECPSIVEEKMEKISIKHFNEQLGDNFKYAKNNKGIALSYIPLNPDTLLLKRLKKDSQSDYIINIKGEVLVNEIGSNHFGRVWKPQHNIAQTTLQIYDLNTLEIIYSRTVSGVTRIDENDGKEFTFIKGGNAIIVTCLKKILKKID